MRDIYKSKHSFSVVIMVMLLSLHQRFHSVGGLKRRLEDLDYG